MLRQCFFCDRPFPEMSLSAEPVRGCTIAYDPHRGRLWLVCSSCRRWSLTPIEDRWEVLDELERRKLRYGLCTLCVGGGMGIATIVERLS